jgi:hypothetical protein
VSLSERDVDTVLIRGLSDDLDDERRRAAADGNDNGTVYPEDMTAEQCRSLRVDELRAASVEVLRLLNFLSLASRGNEVGARFAPALYRAEVDRARKVIDMLDRALELEGE